MTSASKQDLLRQLPGVDALLALAETVNATHELPQKVLKSAIRTTLESLRSRHPQG